MPSPTPGPKVTVKNLTCPHGLITPEPGSQPGPKTGAEVSSPDSATAWAAAETCGACSVYRVPEPAYPCRLESSASGCGGGGQVPGPGHNRITPYKNAAGRRNIGALSLPQTFVMKCIPAKPKPRRPTCTPNSTQASLRCKIRAHL